MFHHGRYPTNRLIMLLVLAFATGGTLAAAERPNGFGHEGSLALDRAPLLTEGFESTNPWPPTDWLRYDLDGGSGSGVWARATAYVHTGTGSAWHADVSGNQNGWLVTPSLAIPATGAVLTFWEYIYYPTFYIKDSLWVCAGSYTAPTNVATPPGWAEVAAFGTPPNPAVWRLQTVNLSAYAGQTIWLGFRYEGNYAHRWYIDDVLVQTNEPILAYQSHALLTDDCPSGGAGDANGFLEPGEDATLSVTLQNTGTYQATGVSAVLSTATAGVTVTQDTSTFPDIPAPGTGTSQTAFAVSLDMAFTCGAPIDFTLTITDASRRATWIGNFSIIVGVPGTPVNLLSENFDSATPQALPPGWTSTLVYDNTTSGTALPAWATNAGTHHPTPAVASHSLPNLVWFNSWHSGNTDSARLHYGTPLDLTSYSVLSLSFWMYHDTGFASDPDRVQVQFSTDGGTNWTDIGLPVDRRGANGWTLHTFDLNAYNNVANFTLGFLGISDWGNDCHLDDILVTGVPFTCTVCLPPCSIDSCGFTATPGYGAAPLDVALDATAATSYCSGAPAFDWNYGDGATGTGQNVTHTYAAGGTYTVTLTVTVDGETCTATSTVTVCELACSAAPDVTHGPAPLTANFTSNVTVTGCTDPVSYLWDFGDGATSTDANPAHTYTAGGSYDWTLTVTSGDATCEASGTIGVCEITGCTATATPDSGLAPLDVDFTGAVNTAGVCISGLPVWAWDFGDGGTAAIQNPSHTYTANGTYTVTMTVTVGGDTCTDTTQVVVTECLLLCEALANPRNGVVPLEVTFGTWTEVTGCTGDLLYHWDFGDGSTSDEQVPTHIYTQGGTYTATLTVTVEGTVFECVSTVQIEADPYDKHFLDDRGQSRLCVNSRTGAFEWQVLGGPNAGIYPGVCQITPQGGLWNYTTAAGLPYELRFRYQPSTGHADGMFTVPGIRLQSGLDDRNLADNPPGCN